MKYMVFSNRDKTEYEATMVKETSLYITLQWSSRTARHTVKFNKSTQQEVGIEYMGRKRYKVVNSEGN